MMKSVVIIIDDPDDDDVAKPPKTEAIRLHCDRNPRR